MPGARNLLSGGPYSVSDVRQPIHPAEGRYKLCEIPTGQTKTAPDIMHRGEALVRNL